MCQYGSWNYIWTALANDMAIVMDLDPFKDVGAGNVKHFGRSR